MGKAAFDKAVVIALHDVEEGTSLFALAFVVFLQAFAYKGELHPRNHQHGNKE